MVYLRLGDKGNAGDTTLTFDSGYYDQVLKVVRPKHKVCWIITQTPEEPRARALAAKYDCVPVSSPTQYTDWTLMLLSPHTLVMGASTFVYFQTLIGIAKEVRERAESCLFSFLPSGSLRCFERRLSYGIIETIGAPPPDDQHHNHHCRCTTPRWASSTTSTTSACGRQTARRTSLRSACP